LREGLVGVGGVRDIRGRGLMLAVELDRPCKDIMKLALDDGLLVNVTADTVVRLLPPLILSDAEADQLAQGVARVVRRFLET
jgi:acetylornithine aminotransferase